MVTTRDAQRLNVALGVGHLSLTLRGENDTSDSAAKPPVRTNDLNDFSDPTVATENFIWMRKGGVREKVPVE
jgi:Flp pilus assembly protein CpaB